MDKNKDQLLDEMLKEHAKHGAGNDEKFLKELDERIAASEKVVEMPKAKQSPGTRWALGSGIAACLAVGFTVHYFTKSDEGDIIAYHDVQLEAPVSEEILLPVEGAVMEELLSQPKSKSAEFKPTAKVKESAQPGVQGLDRLETEAVESGASSYLAKKLDSTRDRRRGDAVESMPSSPSSSTVRVIGSDSTSPRQVPMYEMEVTDEGLRSNAEKKAFLFGRGEAKKNTKSKRMPQVTIGVARYIQPHVQRPNTSGERYGELADNKWTAPLDERSSLSTFAVDVDTASYTNIRRMIREGQAIPKDSVRIEEMLNYFDYQYAQPTGEHPFAVHVDSSVSPWDANNRIVRIGIQGKEIVREDRPATNLVFLLDVSGSMSSDNKLPLLKQSMQYLLEELNENDTVSIVVYAGASGLALPATKVDEIGRQKILEKMNNLSAGGSTAGGQGIQLAYKQAQENFKKKGVNRIILATDGDFNVGVSDNASLTKMVKEKAKSGTYISVLGFGSGNINDAMLESITNNGNGNYSYIDTIKEGRKVLLEDMMGTMVTITKDVKVQVQMNPNKVKAYRLIGYANRMLPPEAFLDKKVDAGEIGAGHTVTALYEIIPADGKPFGTEIDASRYFKQAEEKPNPELKDSKEMMFVKLAYKQPDQKIEDESTYLTVPFVAADATQASEDLTFATAVGLFGMVLRESPYQASGDAKMALQLAKSSKGSDGKGQRAEFIQLVEKYIEKE